MWGQTFVGKQSFWPPPSFFFFFFFCRGACFSQSIRIGRITWRGYAAISKDLSPLFFSFSFFSPNPPPIDIVTIRIAWAKPRNSPETPVFLPFGWPDRLVSKIEVMSPPCDTTISNWERRLSPSFPLFFPLLFFFFLSSFARVAELRFKIRGTAARPPCNCHANQVSSSAPLPSPLFFPALLLPIGPQSSTWPKLGTWIAICFWRE